jgi:hypothetical protein
MTNKLNLLIHAISGICVCTHNSGVTCNLLFSAWCKQFLYAGWGHCNVLDAAVQNLVARSPGSVHHRTSEEFPVFAYYAKLPFVIRLLVPMEVLFSNKELLKPGFGKT